MGCCIDEGGMPESCWRRESGKWACAYAEKMGKDCGCHGDRLECVLVNYCEACCNEL